ncbi:GNAT family N-acetyltransferase [Cohnella sp. 56]|uniref:GNAT family N-acetyltransferase n=1 Tax=Cohnella sp. 56 TaxID=3113722 RepID=UPI0030E938DD
MLLPSLELIRDVEASEIDYMTDRMLAIRDRPGNPEGAEIRQFGNAVCYYSRTMPWLSFNTVKGLTADDVEFIEPIVAFYRDRGRKFQFEVVPSLADQTLLKRLADVGLYQSGFHASLVAQPEAMTQDHPGAIAVWELREDQFDLYAAIHCRGTGLSDDGIPYVAANNRVLYNRPGWKFYIAFVDEEPAAVSVLFIKNNRASFTFAATLPSYRKMGLHRLLLERRLQEAVRNECGIAVSQCAFLSQSHRNMERVGMKLGYVRASWTEK